MDNETAKKLVAHMRENIKKNESFLDNLVDDLYAEFSESNERKSIAVQTTAIATMQTQFLLKGIQKQLLIISELMVGMINRTDGEDAMQQMLKQIGKE